MNSPYEILTIAKPSTENLEWLSALKFTYAPTETRNSQALLDELEKRSGDA